MMDDKVNINTADVTQLTQLTGIGETLAERIIEYRTTVHPFEEVIELTAVPGISERMVRQFEEDVTVNTSPKIDAALTEMAETDDADAVVDAVEEAIEEAVDDVTEPTASAADDGADAIADAVEEAIEEAVDDATEPTAAEMVADVDETLAEAVDDLPDLTPEAADEPNAADEAETVAEAVDDTVPPTDLSFTKTEDDETTPVAPVVDVERPEPVVSERPSFTQEQPMNNAVPNQQNNTPDDTISQRRGCLFIVIGAVAGALLGMALTLGLLAALNNGSLQFADADQRLQTQIRQAEGSMDELNATLEAVGIDVETMSTQADDFADVQTNFASGLDDVETAVNSVQSDVDLTQEELEALQETAVALENQLEEIEGSAETLGLFLTGVRDLLDNLEVEPTEPTPTATSSPTPFAIETRTPRSITSTPPPTRTPRPTATPITLPSSTPAQQP